MKKLRFLGDPKSSKSMAGVNKVQYGDFAPTRRAPLKVWQALYLRHICGCTFRYRFLHFLGIRVIHTNPKKILFVSLLGALWKPSGHLWETFGDQGAPKAPKSVPKAIQRLQGSPKRFEKTTWLAFLKKFDVFSRISSFCIVLASIWLLFTRLYLKCWTFNST